MFQYASIVIMGIHCVTVSIGAEIKFEAEYFSNTTLVCDDRVLHLPQYTTYKKYWILPNETLLQYFQPPNSKYIVGTDPDFNLTIINVEDSDFGWYYCVILWDNYIFLVDSIRIGLNVDGANYGGLVSHYLQNATYGGIAAGVVFGILSLACSIHFCCTIEKKDNTEKNKKKENKKKENKEKKEKKKIENKEKKERKKKEKNADKVKKAEREAIYELDKTVECFDEETNLDGEIAFRFSDSTANGEIAYRLSDSTANGEIAYRLSDSPANDETTDDTEPIVMISNTVKEFYENKAFQMENNEIVPYEETDIVNMANYEANEWDTVIY